MLKYDSKKNVTVPESKPEEPPVEGSLLGRQWPPGGGGPVVQWCPPGGFESTFMLVAVLVLPTLLVYMLSNPPRGP